MKSFLMILAVFTLAGTSVAMAEKPIYNDTIRDLVCHYQFNTRQPGPLVNRDLKLQVNEDGRAIIAIQTQGGSDSLTVERVNRQGANFSAAVTTRDGFSRSIQVYGRSILLQIRDQKTGDVRTVGCLGDVLGVFNTMTGVLEQASR